MNMNRTINILSTSRTALILLLATLLNAATAQGAMKQARLAIYPEYRTLIYLLNAFCATSDEPERYAALIRALNDNIDYTRRHAMHRKQKSDEPQPDGADKE